MTLFEWGWCQLYSANLSAPGALTGVEGATFCLVFFLPLKSVAEASEARREFTGQRVPGRTDSGARAGVRLWDKRTGHGVGFRWNPRRGC